MAFKQFEIWWANLNPGRGTESGKIRPVVVIQTSLLTAHPSTIICPVTTQISPAKNTFRVRINKSVAGVKQDCEILVDQIRAIDNRRFTKRIGRLPSALTSELSQKLQIILDLD